MLFSKLFKKFEIKQFFNLKQEPATTDVKQNFKK